MFLSTLIIVMSLNQGKNGLLLLQRDQNQINLTYQLTECVPKLIKPLLWHTLETHNGQSNASHMNRQDLPLKHQMG